VPVTIDEVSSFAATLPRSSEASVRGRRKFRIGRIVFLSFSKDGTVMGFAFPKAWRGALVESEPEKFSLPGTSDMRYSWVHVRLDRIDYDEMHDLVENAWAHCVPKRVADDYIAARARLAGSKMHPMARRTLDDLLADARARIERLTPEEAWLAALDGAVIVDIRAAPADAVPGSLLVPRTVLEWRLDPDSAWRSPSAPSLAERVLVLCDHGESSSLAAATLVELGFEHAGDVIGGVEAWERAGLPLTASPPPQPGLPGMGPPVPAGPPASG
jgi:rhodanese-related sulfurtransferase